MDIKCLVCLASTDLKMYHSILQPIPNYFKCHLTVKELLKIITSTEVELYANYPNTVCTACLKDLKDSYTFINRFKESQKFLKETVENHVSISILNNEEITLQIKDEDSECFENIIIVNESNSENEMQKSENYPTKKQFFVKNKKQSSTKKSSSEKKSKSGEYVTAIKTLSMENLNSHKRANNLNVNRMKTKKPEFEIENVDGIFVVRKADTSEFEAKKLSHEVEDNLNIVAAVEETSCNLNSKETEPDFNINSEESINTNSKDPQSATTDNNKIQIMSIEDVLKSTTRRSKKIKTIKQPRTKAPKEKPEGPFICDICQKEYPVKRKLYIHKLYSHRGFNKKKFLCNLCGMILQSPSAFYHHGLKHRGKKFSCPHCVKSYYTSSHLKHHIRIVHERNFPNTYLCPECGRKFLYKSGLEYHLKVHKNEKPFVCRYCGFKSTVAAAMKRHERNHTDERPYSCDYCEKTFKGRPELTVHKNMHLGINPYKCQYCGKGFRSTYNMKVHWLQHKGDFPCNICRRNFIEIQVLEFHYQYHHKIKSDNVKHRKDYFEKLSEDNEKIQLQNTKSDSDEDCQYKSGDEDTKDSQYKSDEEVNIFYENDKDDFLNEVFLEESSVHFVSDFNEDNSEKNNLD